MFIDRGESLVFLIDGKRVGLTGEGSGKHRNVLRGPTIRETAGYDVPPSFFGNIARAKKVDLKLSGKTVFVVRTLEPCNQKNLGRFSDEMEIKQGTAPTLPNKKKK